MAASCGGGRVYPPNVDNLPLQSMSARQIWGAVLMGKGLKATSDSRAGTARPQVVVTICTHRKTAKPPFSSTPVSLPNGSQTAVLSAWLRTSKTLPAVMPARNLYAGRGFGLAIRAAGLVSAKVYILSAGLGLVSAEQFVPVYALTVSGAHSESVGPRVVGAFDAAAWFSGVLAGPLSSQWNDIFADDVGRVLIALTKPYAEMVGQSLCALQPRSLSRLRIFGSALGSALPPALLPAIAPYDSRLDAVVPGTRADFSQRALFHFMQTVGTKHGPQDREADYAAVESALDGVDAPDRPNRPRRTDDEILKMIRTRLRSQSGIARILRALRDEDGVACEQARFSRLYRAAVEKASAS